MGVPRARIDAELVSLAPLDPDHRAALWLDAWALHELRARSRTALDRNEPPGRLVDRARPSP
jgi:hypothetical protein